MAVTMTPQMMRSTPLPGENVEHVDATRARRLSRIPSFEVQVTLAQL
jgi:hypothetical protein